MRKDFLPFALPDIDESEFKEVKEVLESGWLTTGPKTKELERLFASYVGAKHAIAVNSCTAAMHLGLEAIGVQSGDFVLTSPYTFAASAEVIRYFDAVPVFVDVEPDTLNLDPVQLNAVLKDLHRVISSDKQPETVSVKRAVKNRNGRIKAVIPIHIAGHPCDLNGINATASEFDIAVIEDAAHSLPTEYHGKMIGGNAPENIPRLYCFSFYATKTITTGEGGMITTDDDAIAERCRIMSLHGISKDAWKRYTAEGSWYYEIIAPGFKYNLPDLSAAVGLAQLRKIETMWKRRSEIAKRYDDTFGTMPELQTPVLRENCTHAWHLYILRLSQQMSGQNKDGTPVRNRVIDFLKDRNIGTSVHFIPLHTHPYYTQLYGYTPGDFPVAYGEYLRALSLPIYSKMTDNDVEDVISAVLDAVEELKAK